MAKIQTRHRALLALVYVRQSSLQQIHDHPESRARQYALAGHAVQLGWSAGQVVVIDEDQGQSGQRADCRQGFQRLLTEVTLGRVGIVLGLEMSRLARSCKDWHHLLEVCALVGALIADQDGVYDPRDANDRLLLGLTGIMCEAELVTMRNRLIRGRWNKAERGELFTDPPHGYVKLPTGELALDPDEQVQSTIRLIFDQFDALGSAYRVLCYLTRHDIRIGIRERVGPRRGQLKWVVPDYSMIHRLLHHPFYAGAYAYGRCGDQPAPATATGRRRSKNARLSLDEWKVLLRDRVPAYIPWERFLANQRKLQDNATRHRRSGPPRSGQALLTGLVTCGVCGWRMRTNYPANNNPHYFCQRHIIRGGQPCCGSLTARCVDELVGELVMHAVKPAAIEASLLACATLDQERERVLRLRRQDVERARFEAERAERQYHAVEPENRLVARTLELRWEERLRAVRQAEVAAEQAERSLPRALTPADRERIWTLAADVPTLWHAAESTNADRKVVVRCLIESVCVHLHSKSERVRITVHWKGDTITEHEVIRPVREYSRLEGYAALKERMTGWRHSGMTVRQIVDRLNDEGWHAPKHPAGFTEVAVQTLLTRWGMSTDKAMLGPLPEDEWWLPDLIRALPIDGRKLRKWVASGWVHARRSPAQKQWIVWADADEVARLRRLRDRSRCGVKHYPTSLIMPKMRT